MLADCWQSRAGIPPRWPKAGSPLLFAYEIFGLGADVASKLKWNRVARRIRHHKEVVADDTLNPTPPQR